MIFLKLTVNVLCIYSFSHHDSYLDLIMGWSYKGKQKMVFTLRI